eukprot:6254301-Prorocentrum_lima.AAC.1
MGYEPGQSSSSMTLPRLQGSLRSFEGVVIDETLKSEADIDLLLVGHVEEPPNQHGQYQERSSRVEGFLLSLIHISEPTRLDVI